MATIDRNPKTCPTLEKAVEWTIDNGQNPDSMRPYLQMPESTILRVCLRRWGDTSEAYHWMLTQANWYHLQDDPEEGDLAVLGGESIISENGGVHMPRDLIHLLVFYENDKWQVCTDDGMSPVDWEKSDTRIIRKYRCYKF